MANTILQYDKGDETYLIAIVPIILYDEQASSEEAFTKPHHFANLCMVYNQ